MLDTTLYRAYVMREIDASTFWTNYQKHNVIGNQYVLGLLNLAFQQQDVNTIKEALVVDEFLNEPMSEQYLDLIVLLLLEAWHYSHEDLVHRYKGLFRTKDAESLYKLVNLELEYLEYDETYQLARKCIYALHAINTEISKDYLQQLTLHTISCISDYAKEVLN